jgi:TonB family protein
MREGASPDMALQRTRAARFARSGSPLNAQPLGHTSIRRFLIALLSGLTLLVAACSTTTGPGIVAYQAGDGVWHQGGRQVVGPVPEDLASPEWPPDLRTPENIGQVLLDIEVSARGVVERAVVTKSVSAASDAEAIRTVRRWKYRPATLRGVPVAVRMKACVTFGRG